MLKTVLLIKKSEIRHSEAVVSEMSRTVEALGKEGFAAAVLEAGSAREAESAAASAGVPADRAETLFVCESGSVLRGLIERGAFAIGYAHADNPEERFPGAPYIVQEPDLVDADSYVKMYQRAAGLPWEILKTRRCRVREFTAEDLDGIYALYDEGALRFLEPPSADRSREEKILRAYIDRIYGLYGFGHWAVVLKDPPDKLIGRIGFSALTSRQEEEAERFGVPAPDADFGFLVGPEWRGLGLAEEVCRALLQYGFSQLGFTCIRADADNNNAASIHLLEKLGFLPVGKAVFEQSGKTAERTVFISVREDPH